jgi:hypothetical protein
MMSTPDDRSAEAKPAPAEAEPPPAEGDSSGRADPNRPVEPEPATIEELGGEPPCQLPRFWDPDDE